MPCPLLNPIALGHLATSIFYFDYKKNILARKEYFKSSLKFFIVLLQDVETLAQVFATKLY